MSNESLTPTDAMPLPVSGNVTQASSTRSIQHSSTILSNVPRLQMAAIVIILVVAVFIAFMLYIRAGAKRKKRLLQGSGQEHLPAHVALFYTVKLSKQTTCGTKGVS
ncbi:hypothetical protein OSTOST_17948 [Ostertagia ostertagi]